MLLANFTALSSIEANFLIAGIGNCFCDLDLDPMTFIYELDPMP